MAESRHSTTDNGVYQTHTGAIAPKTTQDALGDVQERVATFVRQKPLVAMGLALFAGYLVAKIVTNR